MGKTFPKIKVAAAQLAPVFLDLEATVEKACQAIREAGANGARLVAFPETFIPGYPYWALLLDPLSTRQWNRRLFQASMELPGPETDRLAKAAREAGCYAVVGLNERAGGTIYNTQLVLSDRGEILGRRRKLVPTNHERMVWGRGDGRDLAVFGTAFGRLGALICYEHSNALYRYALIAQGEEVHVANWPGGLGWINPVIDAAIRHHAFEAQAFVVSASGLLTREILEQLSPDPAVQKRLTLGGGYSAVVDPRGRFLAGPVEDKETLLYAECDFELIADAKMVVDSAGHSARPDVVRLLLNPEGPEPLVRPRADGGERRPAPAAPPSSTE